MKAQVLHGRWNKVKLGDICDLKYGKSLPKRDRHKGYFPVYGSGGIIGSNNKPLVKAPVIIVGRKGSIGTVRFSKEDCCPIDTVFYIEENQNSYDLKFLYYLLLNYGLDRLGGDAAVPGLNRNVAYLQEITMPSIDLQKKIASILASFDDLIENNTKRIKLLEQTAQLIYKEWFVNFRFPRHEKVKMVDSGTEFGEIPEGWEVRKFKDFLLIKNGFAFKSVDYLNNGVKIIRTKDFASGGFIDEGEKVYISAEKAKEYENFYLESLDFLIVMVGASIGKYGIVFKKDLPSLQNQNMWAIRPKADSLPRCYVVSMMPELIAKQMGHTTGAARDFFRKEVFYGEDILIPNNEVLGMFSESISPVFSEIGILLDLNVRLTKTRDFLLPYLLGGRASL